MEEEKKYLGRLVINASLNKVNLRRQLEFDYVKALAIFGMILIHVYEQLSLADCSLPVTNFYDGFLQFFGGPMAAPVFTFAMGMGIVYSRNSEPDQLIKRGVKLFLCGYLLNITRDVIPYCIMGGRFFDEGFLYLLLNVDIFHLDGLVFILLGFLRKWKVPDLVSGAIAIVVQAIGFAIIPLINIESLVGRCLAGLVVFTGAESCFPLTLWFVYIILGVLFAEYLKHVKNLAIFYKRVFVTFAILLPCYCVTLSGMGFDLRNFYSLADDIYYQQNLLSFIFTFMVIMLELSIGHHVLKNADPNRFHKKIRFLSSNLSVIYVIQWLLIGWTEHVVFGLLDIEGIGVGWVIPIGLLYLLLAVLITMLYNKVKGAIKKPKV